MKKLILIASICAALIFGLGIGGGNFASILPGGGGVGGNSLEEYASEQPGGGGVGGNSVDDPKEVAKAIPGGGGVGGN